MQQTPINDHLNRVRTKCGLDFRVFLLIEALCVAVGFKVSTIAGIVLAIAIPSLAKLATAKDPCIFRLWVFAFSQKAHYDPGKQRRTN